MDTNERCYPHSHGRSILCQVSTWAGGVRWARSSASEWLRPASLAKHGKHRTRKKELFRMVASSISHLTIGTDALVICLAHPPGPGPWSPKCNVTSLSNLSNHDAACSFSVQGEASKDILEASLTNTIPTEHHNCLTCKRGGARSAAIATRMHMITHYIYTWLYCPPIADAPPCANTQPPNEGWRVM